MSILQSPDELALQHGVAWDEIGPKARKNWIKRWHSGPMVEVSGYRRNIIFINIQEPRVYKTPNAIKYQRACHNIENHVKSGNEHRGGRWCDYHGCHHGIKYECKFHNTDGSSSSLPNEKSIKRAMRCELMNEDYKTCENCGRLMKKSVFGEYTCFFNSCYRDKY